MVLCLSLALPRPPLLSSLQFSPMTWATTAGRSSSPRSSSPGLGQGREAREPALKLMSLRCQQESRVPGQSGAGALQTSGSETLQPRFYPHCLSSPEAWGGGQRAVVQKPEELGSGQPRLGSRGRRGGGGEQGKEEEVKKAQVSCLGCKLVAGSITQTNFIYMHIYGIRNST